MKDPGDIGYPWGDVVERGVGRIRFHLEWGDEGHQVSKNLNLNCLFSLFFVRILGALRKKNPRWSPKSTDLLKRISISLKQCLSKIFIALAAG